MTVAKVMEALGLKLLTKDVCLEGEVTGGCVCDLLSVVMAEGEAGMAWITVQTHLNVIAVASLHEFSCVIVSGDAAVEAETLEKAQAEGIPVLVSPETNYSLAGKLYQLGIH
ncbi:MAG: AraC family transcriptional regulator [Oscillospiraceae bacterium]|nr:hypothetical protein [Christensenellales bacterium]HIR68054.1 serine kinase [Candidatus Pelethousia gallinarum]